MARADRLPPTIERVGFQDTFCTLGWVVVPSGLEFPFQTIDIRSVNRPMSKHDVGRKCEGAFE